VGLPERQKPKPPLGNHCTRECRISEFKAVVRFIQITFAYKFRVYFGLFPYIYIITFLFLIRKSRDLRLHIRKKAYRLYAPVSTYVCSFHFKIKNETVRQMVGNCTPRNDPWLETIARIRTAVVFNSTRRDTTPPAPPAPLPTRP
jgi:hypothetical protein